jgi:hypothetical protein
MKTRRILMTFVAVSAGFVAIPRIANAHHGWEDFNSNSEVKFDGTVRDFHFTNPHCVVEFDVKDEKGQVRKWEAEFASPLELARKGWTAATLQPGDKISVAGNPAKNGAPSIHLTSIHLANGKELKLYNGR